MTTLHFPLPHRNDRPADPTANRMSTVLAVLGSTVVVIGAIVGATALGGMLVTAALTLVAG